MNHYQIIQATLPRNERDIITLKGQQIDPFLKDACWINALGAKTFCSWLQLLAISERSDEDGVSLYEMKSKNELIKIFDVAASTFDKNVIIPLFNAGLIDLEDIEHSEAYNVRGLPCRRIIVYRCPFNQYALLTQPLDLNARNYATDFNSKAKTYGILGVSEKRKKQIEDQMLVDYDEQNGLNYPTTTVVDTVDKYASEIRSIEDRTSKNNASKNRSIEIQSYSHASEIRSIPENVDIPGFSDSMLRKLEAVEYMNNTSSINNTSLLSLERESNNNIYNITTPIENNLNEYERTSLEIVEKELSAICSNPAVTQKILLHILQTSKSRKLMVCLQAALKQAQYMKNRIMKNNPIYSIDTFFINGYDHLLSAAQDVQDTPIESENIEQSSPGADVPTKKVAFYNWLEERE